LGAYQLMLVAAALLTISVFITNAVNSRESRWLQTNRVKADTEAPLGKEGGFGLVLGHRYLFLIALLMVVLNLVNTTGGGQARRSHRGAAIGGGW